jgi:hypothetical protein
MKIRAGFVSNSSSTSFLIIAKRDLNKKDFFELMGIESSSPIASLFEGFYKDVVESIRDEVDFKTVGKDSPIETWFTRESRLSEYMKTRLRDAQRRGLKAYFGWLDSESNPIQTFFCTTSFEVENEKIYFNGLESAW